MLDGTISVSTLKSPLPLVNQTRPAYFLQVILQLKEWSVTEKIHYCCKRPTYRRGPNLTYLYPRPATRVRVFQQVGGPGRLPHRGG